MIRLAIISTHPIQYNAPFFKELSLQKDLNVKIFYTWSQAKGKIHDPGFGIIREWDIPLLEGYEFEFVKNISSRPGSDHFWGIINPFLLRKLREWEPDFILVYGWAFYSHLRVIKYFHKKKPIIFRGDSTILDLSKGLKNLLKRIFLRWVYGSVDICLYVGKNNLDYFKAYGVRDENLKYLPHAVDNERFGDPDQSTVTSEIALLKSKIAGRTLFLFAGKLEKKKNPLLLAQAFQSLNDKKTALLFVGNGELEEELKAITAGINNIYFLPFQNQTTIRAIYHMADILVLPSAWNETWGLVVNEAMAAGLAIIVSDRVGCAPDMVENNYNGFVIRSGDITSLVKSMAAMHGPKLMAMKEASKEKIKNFTIQGNVSELTKILHI